MDTFVYTKGEEDIVVTAEVNLLAGEVISLLSIGDATPASSNVPVLSILSGLVSPVEIKIVGGAMDVTFGFPLKVTTNQRVFVVMLAVAVTSNSTNPYKNADPDSYQDLVGDLEAGKSALSTAMFQFDTDFDPSDGYVMWDLLDDSGTIYASGNAYEYRIQSTGISNVVVAKCVINTPSNLPPTVDNPYQLRYTLKVNDKVAYSYENLTVFGFNDIPLGCPDIIEMQGDIATISLVTDKLYKNYVLEVWADNTKIATLTCGNAERVSSGYYVAGSVDTSSMGVTLRPYQVMWRYWNVPAMTMRESSTMWVVNPSLIQAVEDVKSKINKARQTLYGTADSQFPSSEIMKWLRRAGDAFNGAHGVFTNFSFTNAMGGVREYWLLYAEKFALESQYLLEGEKAFNFSGASISLDVDRTGFLDSMASKLQSTLDSEFKPFKQNLVIKGHTSGDGSGDGNGNFGGSQRGAMGSVGITLTPATLFGGSYRPLNR